MLLSNHSLYVINFVSVSRNIIVFITDITTVSNYWKNNFTNVKTSFYRVFWIHFLPLNVHLLILCRNILIISFELISNYWSLIVRKSPHNKWRVQLFQNWWKWRWVWKLLQEKDGGNAKRGDLSRNGGLPYYIEVFLEIPHDAA